MKDFQDLLNRFTKGEFNYERMGDMPEVRKRTNTILNDPRQMLLNTDANYSNMGSYVPSQMPGAMGGIPTHGIAGNVGAKLGETIGGAFKEGKEAAGDLFNRLLNRRMQNLGTGDLIGMGGIG